MHTCKHAGACTHTLLMSARINNPAEFLLFPSGRMHLCTRVQHEALWSNIIRVMIMNSNTAMDTHSTLSNIERHWQGGGSQESDALSLTQ